MSDYVPTTTDVRHAYGQNYVRTVEYHEEGFAEFDRWLAAHDAEVAATALEDAVTEFENNVGITEFDEQTRHDGIYWRPECIEDAWEAQGPHMDWLRNRAAAIRSTVKETNR